MVKGIKQCVRCGYDYKKGLLGATQHTLLRVLSV